MSWISLAQAAREADLEDPDRSARERQGAIVLSMIQWFNFQPVGDFNYYREI
jgi:hypothetical protein